MVKVRENLIGKVFGKLTVVQQADDYISPSGRHDAKWLCRCECGNEIQARASDLKRKDKKHIISCGHCPNKYDLDGEYGICYLQNGEECLFDIEDYNKIKQYRWHKDSCERVRTTIHNKNGKASALFMHNVIMCPPDGMVTDHIHGKTLDNRKCELRICTPLDNGKNKKKPITNTSGYKGVSWSKKHQKWSASIKNNQQQYWLGYFDTKEDAHYAYEQAAKEMFGEYKREDK